MTVRPVWAATAWLGEPTVGFVDGIRQLLRLSQGLDVAGWEVSCRISLHSVSSQRLLMGLRTEGVAPSRLHGIAGELGMPEHLAESFRLRLSHTSEILLAVEARQQDLELRAYQRYDNPQDAVSMRGFKWMRGDPDQYRITEYARADKTSAEIVSVYEQQARAASLGHRPATASAYQAAAAIARSAQQRYPIQRSVDFLNVSEMTGERLSSCLRLYESGLQFRDVLEPISELLSRWELDSERARIISVMTTRPLGWIAVGEDSARTPFLTVYGQGSLLDARRAIGVGVAR